jgi:uncharacterized iron-regulated membrane protein
MRADMAELYIHPVSPAIARTWSNPGLDANHSQQPAPGDCSLSVVPGSLLRRILFWAHLSCGVSAGLIILLMSATGVLLTYEHQLVARAALRNHVAAPNGAARLSADELAATATGYAAPEARLSLMFDADPSAPVAVSTGRATVALLNPYTGADIPDGSAGRREFFATVERLHRWMGGDARGAAANLIDFANLLFLFIIASGIYLWLPAVWRWRTVRGLLLFRAKYVNSKVRDFNWHHVFSAWALLPLFVIALSGVVMSYPWANRMVFAVFGEQVPQRAGPPPGAGRPEPGPASVRSGTPSTGPAAAGLSLQQLLNAAQAQEPDWQRITLPLQARGERIAIAVELKSAQRRAPRRTITLRTADGSVITAPPVQVTAQSPGQRARSWLRFAHTGEQYGLAGQTVAGLASLAACFLAYTGLALAWRRLIVPLWRRG